MKFFTEMVNSETPKTMICKWVKLLKSVRTSQHFLLIQATYNIGNDPRKERPKMHQHMHKNTG